MKSCVSTTQVTESQKTKNEPVDYGKLYANEMVEKIYIPTFNRIRRMEQRYGGNIKMSER